MSNSVSGTWYLTDNSLPEPDRDGTERFPVESEEDLVRVLREYAVKEARVVVIESPCGAYSFVGIGGPLAGLNYYRDPKSGRSVTAKPRKSYADEERWFMAVGEPYEIRAVNLMPVDQVIEIIVHLFRTGELADWVDWM